MIDRIRIRIRSITVEAFTQFIVYNFFRRPSAGLGYIALDWSRGTTEGDRLGYEAAVPAR